MRYDSVAVSRHRWFVVMIMLVGALNVLLAGGFYYHLRSHISSYDVTRLGEVATPIMNELDYRIAMGGGALLCFTLGAFLFFVAVAVDISFRQKAIIRLLLRASQRAGRELPETAGAPEAASAKPLTS